MFVGETLNYIRCLDVDYESSKKEKFRGKCKYRKIFATKHCIDLALNVRNHKDIYSSMDAFVEEELLKGENQYDAGGDHILLSTHSMFPSIELFGKQDAAKGTKFLKFPPVLYIQLKRFEYNAAANMFLKVILVLQGELNDSIKVNDKYAFYSELDLNKYLHENTDKSIDYKYVLFWYHILPSPYFHD